MCFLIQSALIVRLSCCLKRDDKDEHTTLGSQHVNAAQRPTKQEYELTILAPWPQNPMGSAGDGKTSPFRMIDPGMTAADARIDRLISPGAGVIDHLGETLDHQLDDPYPQCNGWAMSTICVD